MNQLPHSNEAEQAVIGGCLLDPKAITRVECQPADFYAHSHRVIAQALREMEAATQPIDAVTLGEHLTRSGELGDAGGPGYLAELLNNTPSAANVEHYSAIVRDYARRRDVLQTLEDGRRDVEDGTPTSELIERVASKLSRLALTDATHQLSDGKALAMETVDAMQRELDGEIPAIATGLRDLDAKLGGGPRRGDLVVIGARPSMGKSTLRGQYARTAAQHFRVLDLSLEDNRDSITRRHLSAMSGVNLAKLRAPATMEDGDWDMLLLAQQKLCKLRYKAAHIPGASIEQIKAIARKEHARDPVDVVCIDYLQLMTTPKADRLDQALGEISKQCKQLAGELNCVVVLLSQLNRSLEARQDKRPKMADIRECGALEQDADIIIFLYRDEVYNQASDKKGICEAIVAKQRNGEIGIVPMVSRLGVSSFGDLGR